MIEFNELNTFKENGQRWIVKWGRCGSAELRIPHAFDPLLHVHGTKYHLECGEKSIEGAHRYARLVLGRLEKLPMVMLDWRSFRDAGMGQVVRVVGDEDLRLAEVLMSGEVSWTHPGTRRNGVNPRRGRGNRLVYAPLADLTPVTEAAVGILTHGQ